MIQPNVYWSLKTPLVTIIGLYSNVPGQLDKQDTAQENWLTAELLAAKDERCLIVTVHHPPYSLDSVHGGHPMIAAALDRAFSAAGKLPTVVLTGHVHNYQRFSRDMRALGGTELPYVVAGAGGFAGYTNLHQLKPDAVPPPGIRLVAHDTVQPGFLRMTVTPEQLIGEYFTVPPPPDHLTGEAKLSDRFEIALI